MHKNRPACACGALALLLMCSLMLASEASSRVRGQDAQGTAARVSGAFSLRAPVYLYASGHGRAAPGRARVDLASPAPAGGATLTVASAPPGLLTHDPSVFVPEGATSAHFNIAALDTGRHEAALLTVNGLGDEHSAVVGVIPAAGNACPPRWRQAVDYPLSGTANYAPASSGWGARSPSVADFNNDGWMDIAVIDRGAGVAVFLNAGAGDGLLLNPILIPGDFRSLQAIDVDGDGLTDLVVFGASTDFDARTKIIRNIDGASFEIIQTLSLFPSAQRAVYATDTIASAPSGTLPDIAWVQLQEGYSTFPSGGVRVAANQGAGTFSGSAQAFLFTTTPCGFGTTTLYLADCWPGDFNADGRLDLLLQMSCSTTGTPLSYRRMLTGGSGSNAGFLSSPGPSAGGTGVQDSLIVAIGDYTGDGADDVFTLQVFSGNPPTMRLTLHPIGALNGDTYNSTFLLSSGGLVVDADANGWNDLLFFAADGPRIFYNDGDGGLGGLFADDHPGPWGWSAMLDDDPFPDIVEIVTDELGQRVLRTHLTAFATINDVNANNIPDECEPDCNGNGLPDAWEVEQGLATDCNNNNILDECEVVPPLVEVVFVMDTSLSMFDEGAALCSKITQVIAELEAEGFSVQAELWGITEGGSQTFPCLTSHVAAELGTQPATPGGFTLGNSEDWAPATAIVAARYPWQKRELGLPHPLRIIVPISDEGARNGDPCVDPGEDRDAVENAIVVALANDVIVSPIAGTGSGSCVTGLMSDLASATGGTFFISTDPEADLAAAIADLVINAAARDCNANGVPDECDIASGFSADTNDNGVPDECEGLSGCPSDLNDDQVVDGADLGLLLLAWGSCAQCPSDLNDDGVVDGADLGLLLLAWGACP